MEQPDPNLPPPPELDGPAQVQAQLGLLYAEAAQNIRFGNRQRWFHATYGLLIYAALIGIGQLTGPDGETPVRRTLAAVLPWAPLIVGAFAIFTVAKTQYWILSQRQRLARLHRVFAPEFREARGNRRDFLSFNRDWEILVFLHLLLIFGALFVSWSFGEQTAPPVLEFFFLLAWASFNYLVFWAKNRNDVARAGL